MLFFKNVDYLRRKRGLKITDIIKGLKDKGFTINRHAINRYKKGQYWSARISYLDAYAHYFGVGLGEMLSIDYEHEEEIREMQRE